MSELLADAQALGRAVRLGASDDTRGLAIALTAILDAIAADLLPRSESEAPPAAEVTERLEAVVADLLSLLHGDDEQLRDQFIGVQRKLTYLLKATSRTAEPDGCATAGDTQLDDDEGEDAGGDADEPEAKEGGRKAAITRSEQGLRRVAEAYRKDADQRSRMVLMLGLIALATVGVATAMAWYMVTRWGGDAHLTPGGFLARCAPALALYAVSALLAHQATRMRRGVDELRRLERQLQGITAYLHPLPADTQDLVRAAMTQRLFPRLIEDDPLREEDWFPDSEYLLASINPDLPRLLGGDEADDDESES